MLTPGRNGPDPTPKPRDDEPYVSVLRQDGSEVQGAVAINLSQASEEIIENENDVVKVGSFQE